MHATLESEACNNNSAITTVDINRLGLFLSAGDQLDGMKVKLNVKLICFKQKIIYEFPKVTSS